jgi:CDP-diacylglycerol---glycerol-3-phosphate 3-phosphatidyltransferase
MNEVTNPPLRRNATSPSTAPRGVLEGVSWALDLGATGLLRLRLTANAITVSSVVVAAVGAVLLAIGDLGPAALAMALAAVGDALDGRVARRTESASVGGALLDASADRYEECLLLGGLAVQLRASVPALVLVLAAVAGSFMVSYGSAKAEALGVPVPPSVMRRPGRAACLCAGVALCPPFGWLVRQGSFPGWSERTPVIVAIGLIAVLANVSAIRRLRQVAIAAGQ